VHRRPDTLKLDTQQLHVDVHAAAAMARARTRHMPISGDIPPATIASDVLAGDAVRIREDLATHDDTPERRTG